MSPERGRIRWAQALDGPLAGVTCLWQDLDGLHVQPAPTAPPSTSLLWGWRQDGYLVRIRLDGETAYIATHHAADPSTARPPTKMLPWALNDDRIAASHGRGPALSGGGTGATYEQITIDGIEDDTGPITFLRPAIHD